MLQQLRRLLSGRPDGIPQVSGQGITSSVSPLPLRGLNVNPRQGQHPCCAHCAEFFAPADCPGGHNLPCPDCDGAA